jgi:hypothetical protein
MEKVINVKKVIGEEFSCEDALLLKRDILNSKDAVTVLDFDGISDVPTTFFYNLFSELLYTSNRTEAFEKIKVKNLITMDNYNKVVLGTAVM